MKNAASTARDAIWQHPDLMPTSEDLDDPAGFSKRRELLDASDSDVDAALRRLLEGGFNEPPRTKPPKTTALVILAPGNGTGPAEDRPVMKSPATTSRSKGGPVRLASAISPLSPRALA